MRPLLALLLLLPLAACSGAAPAAQTTTAPQQLRILSYNIRHGSGADNRIDLERIAAVITAQDPDLVALQEVDDRTSRSGEVDQATELGRLTGMHAVFGKAMDYQGGGYGEAVLSRFPLVAQTVHALPHADDHEPRAALQVQVEPPGWPAPVTFVGTHLDHTRDPADRLAQAEALRELFAEHEGYVVLAGDLNDEVATPTLQTLLATFEDASAGQPSPTWPAPLPWKRIDFVLLGGNEDYRVVESRVIEETEASDHRPVLVVLELER